MAQKYNTKELIRVLPLIGEIEPVKLWTKLGREEYMRNYFKVLNGRIYQMPLPQLFKITQTCWPNKALRSSFVTDNLWRHLGHEFIRKKEHLDPSNLVDIVSKYALINNSIKKQIFKVLEDKILEIDQPLQVHEWSQLLWGYSFTDYGSEQFYDKICNEIMAHPELPRSSTNTVALLPYYAKRVSKEYKILTEFCQNIGIVISYKIDEIIEIDDLLKISKYVFKGGIDMETEVIKKLEDKMFELAKKHRGMLVKNIMFLPNALQSHRIQNKDLFKLISHESQANIRIFNLRNLVMAHKFFDINGDSKTANLVRKQINSKLVAMDHTSIPFRILNYVTKGIIQAGLFDGSIIQNLERLILDQIQQSKASTDFFLVYSLSMFNLGGIGSMKFYEAIRKEFIKESRLKSGHTTDLARAISTFGQCTHLYSEELNNALDEKLFYFNRHMTGNQMASSTYSFARVNRCSPEIFPLMKKRLVETHTDNMNNLAAGIWGLTQQGTDARQLIAQALDTFAEDDVEYGREVPEYTETRLRACALVQLAWAALLSGSTDVEYWEPYRDLFSSIEVSDNFTYTLDEFVIELKLENREREFFECIDRFHVPFYNQVCSMLNIPAQKIIPMRSRARHRDQVRSILKPGMYKEAVSDAYGTLIDFKLGKDVALMLKTERDYVYLSPGYNNLDGKDDMVGFQRFRRKLIQNKGYKIIDVPHAKDMKDLLINSGLSTSQLN